MMPEGQGAPASPQAARSAPDRRSSAPEACPESRGSPELPAPRRGAIRASVPQKLAEALSSQYGLNVFVAGLLLLLAWAVHASGVGKSDLLCFLTALMLLQLLWMLWYVGRSAAHRRLIRLKDTHAGARWLRGESGRRPPGAGGRARARPARPPAAARQLRALSPLDFLPLVFSVSIFPALPSCPPFVRPLFWVSLSGCSSLLALPPGSCLTFRCWSCAYTNLFPSFLGLRSCNGPTRPMLDLASQAF